MDTAWEREPEEKWPRVLVIVGVVGLVGILALVLAGSFALALLKSPPLVPEPVAVRSVEGWGEFFDPSGDCALSTNGATLTIEIPGSVHDLSR